VCERACANISFAALSDQQRISSQKKRERRGEDRVNVAKTPEDILPTARNGGCHGQPGDDPEREQWGQSEQPGGAFRDPLVTTAAQL